MFGFWKRSPPPRRLASGRSAVASSQRANGVRLPSPPVSTVVAIVAFRLARPRSGRCCGHRSHAGSSPFPPPTAGTRRRPRSSAGSASSSASAPGSGWRPRSARSSRPRRSSASTPRSRSSSPRARRRPVRRSARSRSSRRRAPPRRSCSRPARTSSSSTTEWIGDAIAVVWLDRRDERLQPARQHGRPRGDARRDRLRLLRRRRGHRPLRPSASLAFALAGAFACVGFLPFNLRPTRPGARLHGRLRQPDARLRARRARARRRAGASPGRPSPRSCCRS